MPVLPIYAMTVFEEDDTTPLFTVSTDPLATYPYLKAPDNFPEQEVDFAKGSASIGQMNVQVVDVAQTPGDQTTGFVTGMLATAGGYSAINGRRVLVTQDIGAGAETILDGVCKGVVLLDTFATYQFELRDIRERERKTKAFETTDTPTILPRGVLNGYGIPTSIPLFGGGTYKYPIPPTRPLTGGYWNGEIALDLSPEVLPELALTPAMREALEHVAPLATDPSVYYYDRWQLLWREAGSGDPWTTVTRVAQDRVPLFYESPMSLGGVSVYGVGTLHVNNTIDGDTLPSNGDSIEIIIQYVGPTTKEWGYHLDGLTVGDLIANAYDGDYSVTPPRVFYNASAVAALTTPIRGIVNEPVADLREWLEKHAYSIAHAAPTMNADGEVAPVTYLLPPAGASLATLDDANCAPDGAGWVHGTADAINVVVVTYVREYRLSKKSIGVAESDRILEQPAEARHEVPESIDLLGEQKLEISGLLLRAIGTVDGGPLDGDIVDEVGQQVAERAGFMATDRLVLGGQVFRVRGMRSDADVESLVCGSWAECGFSWMPDYNAGVRGLSRLAQVIGRRNIDAAWCSLTLIDAGSANAPVSAPTLGSISIDAAGILSVPVSALGSGADARIEYAVLADGDTAEPAATSSLWSHLERVDATGTVTSPPVPPGRTVWVRARGELAGRRPSAWTTAVDEVAPDTPRVFDVALVADAASGTVLLLWAANPYCSGVEVVWEIRDRTAAPGSGTAIELDADDLEYAIPGLVAFGYVLTATVTPYDGWTGSAVSGTAGPEVVVQLAGAVPRVTVILDHLRLQPVLPTAQPVRWAQYLAQGQSSSTWFYRQSITLPVGVQIVNFRARCYAEDANCDATAQLRRIDASDVAQDISSVLAWANEGPSWKEEAVDHVTAGEEAYQVEVSLFNNNANVSGGSVPSTDARFYRAEIEYIDPTFAAVA